MMLMLQDDAKPIKKLPVKKRAGGEPSPPA